MAKRKINSPSIRGARVIAVFTVVSFIGCGEKEPPRSEDQGDVPSGERPEVLSKQESAPGEADYLRYDDLVWESPEKAQTFLVSAASQGYPPACKELATQPWPDDFDYQSFGATPEEARIILLEKASSNDFAARWELGCKYRDGSEAIRNLPKARTLLREASEGMEKNAWYDYAKMAAEGAGGPPDYSEAYFYLSAAAAVTHPESFLGKKIWELRDSTSSQLSKTELLALLDKLDQLFAQEGKPIGFNEGHANPPESVDEGRKLAAEMEADHRAKINLREGK